MRVFLGPKSRIRQEPPVRTHVFVWENSINLLEKYHGPILSWVNVQCVHDRNAKYEMQWIARFVSWHHHRFAINTNKYIKSYSRLNSKSQIWISKYEVAFESFKNRFTVTFSRDFFEYFFQWKVENLKDILRLWW